jgi:hypothetical protein
VIRQPSADHSPQEPAHSADALAAELGRPCLDLAAVVAAWPRLPEALRAGILAMVKAAASEG